MSTSLVLRPGVSVRRGADRHQTRIGWLHGRHSFDTGIDPLGTDTHYGVLVVSNHDTIAPRSGFETHPHRNMEIVTWVLDGSLVHQDSEGHTGVIYPNLAQRMTAGTGIRHSEKNDRPAVNPIRNRYAALHVARLEPGESVTVPDAPFVHVYLARGRMDLEAGGRLDAGDAARLTAAGERRLAAAEPSEVLIWEMHAGLARPHPSSPLENSMSLSRPARGADHGLPPRPMSTFPLGPIRVRRSGYGAMQLAGPWAVNAPPDRASAIGVLRAAVTAGIDHIDTAQYYGPDVVNDLIGEALYPYPQELAIVSKVGIFRDTGHDARQLRQGIEDNLRSLRVGGCCNWHLTCC